MTQLQHEAPGSRHRQVATGVALIAVGIGVATVAGYAYRQGPPKVAPGVAIHQSVPSRLRGTSWQLSSATGSGGAKIDVAALRLAFPDAGTASASDGCHSFTGTLMSGSTSTLTVLDAAKLPACTSKTARQSAAALDAVLSAPASWDVTGAAPGPVTLTLHARAGVLVYRSEPAAPTG